MGFDVPTRTFERVCLALLYVSAFGLSSTLECNDFYLRNDDDRGDWNFYTVLDSTECFLCFRRTNGNSQHPELVLPCMDQGGKPTNRQVQFQFRRTKVSHTAHEDSMTLIVEGEEEEEEEADCQHDYNSATDISNMTSSLETNLADLESERTPVIDLHPMYSYRLKIQTAMSESGNGFIVCLTNVTFRPPLTEIGNSATVFIKTTSTNMKTQGGKSTGVTGPTSTTNSRSASNGNQETALGPTGTTSSRSSSNDNPNTALLETGPTGTISSRSSSNDNPNTALQKTESKFPIWVIFVIIAIVIISICAIAVFIRRRQQYDHQPANNVSTGRVNDKSNGRKDNMKNDKDVIANPTYGQESVNGKEAEYHSYTEIDVKVPDNSEMIYNSAYESPPANSDMIYNSVYESPPATSDMIYNSAYESPSASSDMVYNSAYESSPPN